MSRPMTKAQIIEALSIKTGLSKTKIRKILETLAEFAYENAVSGFTIPGIGKLIKVKRAARIGRNPATGESIKITAKTILKFRIAKELQATFSPPPSHVGCMTSMPSQEIVSLKKCKKIKKMPLCAEGMSRPEICTTAPSSKSTANFVKVKVYYGTNRKKTDSDIIGEMYGTDRGSRIRFGVCDVGIPLRKHRRGEVERPKLYKLEFREDPEKHVVLLRAKEMGQVRFATELNKGLDRSDEKQAFVFVHGFNTTFQQAVWRAAQIAHDLKFDGVPIVFSWPTQGECSKRAYRIDETNADPSILYCHQFLEKIVDTTKAKKIHLIAHSMGNKVLTNAIMHMMLMRDNGAGVIFNQIILAAPDIDADVFKDTIAPAMQGVSNRTTLYAAANDRALEFSKKLHGGYSRAGYIDHGITLAKGIDSIDASAVNTGFIGHWVYTASQSVMDDIYYLLTQQLPPAKRAPLFAVPRTGTPTHYRFVE